MVYRIIWKMKNGFSSWVLWHRAVPGRADAYRWVLQSTRVSTILYMTYNIYTVFHSVNIYIDIDYYMLDGECEWCEQRRFLRFLPCPRITQKDCQCIPRCIEARLDLVQHLVGAKYMTSVSAAGCTSCQQRRSSSSIRRQPPWWWR